MRRYSRHLTYLMAVFLVACGDPNARFGSEHASVSADEQEPSEGPGPDSHALPNPDIKPVLDPKPVVVVDPVPVVVEVVEPIPVSPIPYIPGGGGGRRVPRIFRDFGDAPISYGTLLVDDGARHTSQSLSTATGVAPLMLGASIDAELDGFPSVGADGDDFNNTDDENGVAAPIAVTTNVATTVTVNVTNNNPLTPATLVGWIDFDLDGTFEASEVSNLVPIPPNTIATDFPVLFLANDTVLTSGTSYARFRLYPGALVLADVSPTGLASDGEVEDYPVTLTAELDFGDAPASYDEGDLNPARHSPTGLSGITASFTIGVGTTVDVELSKPASDDTTGIDDETTFLMEPVLLPFIGPVLINVPYSVAGTATVAGWIDFNLDGDFDNATERAIFSILAPGGGIAPLNFPIPPDAVAGDTWIRIRIFPGIIADPSPVGSFIGGEVEDFPATFLEPPGVVGNPDGEIIGAPEEPAPEGEDGLDEIVDAPAPHEEAAEGGEGHDVEVVDVPPAAPALADDVHGIVESPIPVL